MNCKGRHFISTTEWSEAELTRLLDRAKEFKEGRVSSRPLEGKSVAMLFFNPSLRTRTSFEIGITQLGGTPVVLSVGKETWSVETRDGVVMDADKTEHVKDAVRVLGRYVDALCVRAFPGMQSREEDLADHAIEQFRKYSARPVINMESSLWHPCQSMADMMTIREKRGGLRGKWVALVWVWHPKPLPTAVPNSFAAAAEQFGCKLVVAHPPGYDLPKGPKGTHDFEAALRGADVVYPKSWGSLEYYGRWEEEKQVRERYRDWIVDEKRMALTKNASFLHCLPMRRNVEATDAVVDGPQSAIYDEAENRLHVQKAILEAIV